MEMRTKAKVHTLLPGVTGWAQINGRDNNDDTKKTVHDVYYLNNKSFVLDVKILFRTVFKVIKAEGINDDGLKSINDDRLKSIDDNELKTRRSKDYPA